MGISAKQVAQYAKDAGFSGHNLVVAVAISHAESGWNPSALGDTSLETAIWGPSVGLWQIRSLKREYGTGQDRDEKYLLNPLNNARAAYKISGGHNFSAWSTYNNGAYRRYLSQAQAGVNALNPPKVPTSTQPAPAPLPTGTSGAALLGGLGLVSYGFWRKWKRKIRGWEERL